MDIIEWKTKKIYAYIDTINLYTIFQFICRIMYTFLKEKYNNILK